MQSLLDGGAKFSEKEANFEEHGCHISQNYGIRENPKKTLRVVDQNFPLPQDNVCKQCGKVFQSMKALCGHMAFHSERKIVMDNDFGTEFEEKKPRSKKKNGKRCKRISTTKSSSYALANASSSVTEIDEKDQEEIAICLMMISRGYTSFKGGMNPVVEYCDNNSVVLETKSRSNGMRNIKKEGLKCVYNGDEVLGMYKTGDEKLNCSSSQENSDSGYFLDE
ncbi:hypothetical protein LIER_10759 [Lithospermum erythrorhizon]|uniref:C2H2-type domain-containing protein n=1 Tax=Lithospermum erythrorhizon TaxID=34254 RepID=A0AAV3PKE5_LITER